jgi:hypothetical protein
MRQGLNIVIPRNDVVIVPFPQGLEAPTHVIDLEIRPFIIDSLVVKFREFPKGEHAHVSVAHEVLPKSLDAVI